MSVGITCDIWTSSRINVIFMVRPKLLRFLTDIKKKDDKYSKIVYACAAKRMKLYVKSEIYKLASFLNPVEWKKHNESDLIHYSKIIANLIAHYKPGELFERQQKSASMTMMRMCWMNQMRMIGMKMNL